MKQRCFIAGATGYTGREVVRLLAERGYKTVAHVRPDSPHREDWERRFSQWGAEPDNTPWDQEAMTQRLADLQPTLVFSLLGTTAKRTAREQKEGVKITGYEGVDYGLSVLLLNATLPLDPAPRFIYLSSIGVNGVTGNAYLKARWRVEEALRASKRPHTIARPSFISGPDRDEFRPLERVASVVTDGLFGGLAAVGIRRFRDQWGTVSNTQLASALITSALDPAAADKTLSSRDLAKILRTASAQTR